MTATSRQGPGGDLLPALKHVTESLTEAAGRNTVFFCNDLDLAFQFFEFRLKLVHFADINTVVAVQTTQFDISGFI